MLCSNRDLHIDHEKKRKWEPCVWYSWSTGIFNAFVKQGNSTVSTERQNTAVPQVAFDSVYTYVFPFCKVPHWGWLPFVIKILECFGNQSSRDWEMSGEMSLQQHCHLWQIHSSVINQQEETVSGQGLDAEQAEGETMAQESKKTTKKHGSQGLVLRLMFSALRQTPSDLCILYSLISQ